MCYERFGRTEFFFVKFDVFIERVLSNEKDIVMYIHIYIFFPDYCEV